MMIIKQLCAGAFALVLAMGPLCAQNDSVVKTKKDAELLIPRIHRQPVQSLDLNGQQVMDTISTQTPGVKILLLTDNTWKYYRDPAEALKTEAFTRNWSTNTINPYNTSLADLPDDIRIWVADTLSDYHCPRQTKVYSAFGIRHRRRHQGVDLPLKTGDPVGAAFAGRVRVSNYTRGYGNLVVIRHENGLETYYGHLSKREVEPGDWVEAGQVIGLGGSTGRSTGPHLHFETRYEGYAFDPEWLIDFETGVLRHRLFVLKKRYLDANSKYVPESEDEEYEINIGDERDHAVADSIEAVRQAEREKAAREAAAAQYYKIRSGDTLGKIARRYGTTVNAICRLNPGLTARTTLRVGRSIRVK